MSILDWFGREGGALVAWWALSTLMALAVLPLCARLLGGLADKGYTLARTVGLLLVSWVFWLLASLGLLNNSAGSMVLALALVAGVAWLWIKRDFSWRDYWQANRRVIVASEVLFPSCSSVGRLSAFIIPIPLPLKNRWNWRSSAASCAVKPFRRMTLGWRAIPSVTTTLAM